MLNVFFKKYSIAPKKATSSQPLSASAYHKLIATRLSHAKHAVPGKKRTQQAQEGYVIDHWTESPTYDCEELVSTHHHPVYEKKSYWPLNTTGYVYTKGVGIGQVAQQGDLMVITPVDHREIENVAVLDNLNRALLECVL